MSNEVKDIYKEWLNEAINPLKAYLILLRKMGDEATAQEIIDNRVDVKLLVNGMVGGWILSALIDFFVGDEGLPELIMLPLLMIAYLFSTVIVYPGLKRLGGRGTFNQTFIAIFISSAVYPPFASLVGAFDLTLQQTAAMGMAFMLPLLPKVHKLSSIRTAMGIIIGQSVMIIGFSLIYILMLEWGRT